MATALYDRIMAFDHGDVERAQLMHQVWCGTPWMADAYTGNFHERREREMLEWCDDQFGPEASPIHRKVGIWHRGCATIHGWTWFGFSSEADMERFLGRWPPPEGVRVPN